MPRDIDVRLKRVVNIGSVAFLIVSIIWTGVLLHAYSSSNLLFQIEKSFAAFFKENARGISDYTAFIAFTVCSVIETINFVSTRNVLKKHLAILFLGVSGISAISYLLLILGLTPSMVDFNGRHLEPARYFHWCLTTPLLIGSVSCLAATPNSETISYVVSDLVMIVSGFLSSYSHQPIYILGFSFLSFAAWTIVMRGMWVMFHDAVRRAIHPDDEISIKRLLNFTLVLWSTFPLVWVLSALELISEDVAEFGFVFSDCSAKFVFSFLFSSHDFMSYNRVDMLQHLHDESVFTDLASTNRHLEQAANIIQKGTAAVSEKEENQKVFMRTMSHELRTPLNSIISFNSLLLESGSVSPREVENVLTSLGSAESLRSMIDNLLNFNKIQSTGVVLEKKLFDFYLVIENAIHHLDHLAEKNKVGIFLSVDATVPKMLRGDPVRLGEILYNVIQNGVKFNHAHGSVYIDVQAILLSPKKVDLRIRVKDSGIGIPDENLSDIFKPFAKLKNVSDIAGTGVGLPIVHELVTVLNGHVNISSTVGIGTTVELALPFKKSKILHLDVDVYPAGVRIVDAMRPDYAYRGLVLTHLNVWACEVLTTDAEGLRRVVEEKGAGWIYFVTSVEDIRFISGRHPDARIVFFCNLLSKINLSGKVTANISFALEPITASRILPFLSKGSTNVVLSSSSKNSSGTSSPSNNISLLKVLVVDDNPINRKVAGAILRRWDISFEEAADGSVCVEMMGKQKYDVILMDIQMPVMDGLEATRKIREMGDRIRQPYIIACSANCLDSDRIESTEAGMSDFVPKPVKIHMLEQSLQRATSLLSVGWGSLSM